MAYTACRLTEYQTACAQQFAPSTSCARPLSRTSHNPPTGTHSKPTATTCRQPEDFYRWDPAAISSFREGSLCSTIMPPASITAMTSMVCLYYPLLSVLEFITFSDGFKHLQAHVAPTAYASHQDSDAPRCHPNTRKAVLNTIMDWVNVATIRL